MDDRTNVIDKLVGQINWAEWKFQARITMCAGECFDVVTGDSTRPTAPVDALPGNEANAAEIQAVQTANATARTTYETALAAYTKKEMKAQKIIGMSLTREPMMHIMNSENAKLMWDKLHSIYEQKSQCSIHFLQQKYYNFTKDPNDNLATHFSKLDEIVQQLNDLGEEISNSMIMTKILLTLPSNYSHFHSAWESTRAEERTIENLRTRLMVEESRMSIQEGDSNSMDALIAKKSKSMKSRKQPGKCFSCGEGSHWRRDCPKRKKERESKGDGSALVCVEEVVAKCDDWYLDSGATWHMTCKKNWLSNYETLTTTKTIRIGNGTHIQAHGKGDIKVSVFNGDVWSERILVGVYYVPDICVNLYSVGSSVESGRKVLMDDKQCKVVSNGVVVAVGARVKGLYKMCFKVLNDSESAYIAVQKDSIKLWHERFAHQNIAHVKQILKKNKIDFNDFDYVCEACIYGKHHRDSFKSSENRAKQCGELIHTDVCGPFQNVSFGGSKYFVVFKDDYSRYRTVYFLKSKDQVYEKLVEFVRLTNNLYGIKIKKIRSDNGKEYEPNKLVQFLSKEGIHHEKTVPYTPQQNGAAERENRTIVEAARTMLYAKGLCKQLWAEAINTAVYVLNRTGTSTEKDKTPFELWQKKSIFKVFGCDVYAHIPDQKRKKWDAKSKKGIFAGYSETTKGAKVFFPDERKIQLSRDVIFDEKLKTVDISFESENAVESSTENTNEHNALSDDNNANVSNDNENIQNVSFSNPNESILDISNAESIESDVTIRNTSDTSYVPDSEYETGSSGDTSMDSVFESPQSRSPNRWCDVALDNVVRNRLRSGKNLFCEINDAYESAFMAVNNEPVNYNDAVNCEQKEKWLSAMTDEFNSLIQNKTWTLVEKPINASVIDNKWVYKIKYKSNGDIERYKARLVVRGFTQEYGVNYYETFSPVVKFPSMRTILAIAASKNMLMKQFDIKTAFLNSELDETIYMKQPIGYSDGSDKVCKLNKSLYGLKQASRAWNKKFTKFIEQFNFKVSSADPCVFVHSKSESYLTLYVDDGLIVSKNAELIKSVIDYLQQHFEVNAFEAESYLGLQIKRQSNGSIFLHQQNYANRVLKRFNMHECNKVATPADTNAILYDLKNDETILFPYREAVGSLMYLAVSTRPDISYAVGLVSRFLENPSMAHVNAVKRILKYIKGTSTYGIFFQNNKNLVLYAYSDADFAGCVNTRRSTTGYLLQIGSAIVSWSSERQKCVSISTAESEYIASAEAVREMVWLRTLLDELLPNGYGKPILSIDNQSAIKLIKNPEMHRRTKHIDIKFHFIREKFNQKMFSIESVPSEQQLADILTKPLPKERFSTLRNLIGIVELN